MMLRQNDKITTFKNRNGSHQNNGENASCEESLITNYSSYSHRKQRIQHSRTYCVCLQTKLQRSQQVPMPTPG